MPTYKVTDPGTGKSVEIQHSSRRGSYWFTGIQVPLPAHGIVMRVFAVSEQGKE